ncbi:MAG TPA: sensor histidine kinase [Gemmatimonadaceae bacterium]|nr:sensor histidine kinase [Gemmatimonadaceae bacterium]
MRLAEFITTQSESILADWVTFAESCGPAGGMLDLVGLRDHAHEMLKAIALDLGTTQTPAEQRAKSTGDAATTVSAATTAATIHGSARAEHGFTVGEMVSEYRALRASVIRLWTAANGQLTGADLEDLMRFNEAIDQALAESITRYSEDVERAREVFLGILGHDLRTPIGAITMSSQFMVDTGELVEPHLTLARRITASSKRMSKMVEDLLDFTRGRLGTGIPITRSSTDLRSVVRDGVDEVAAARPTSVFQYTARGDLRGQWDAPRLTQVVTNLLNNSAQHGAVGGTINVAAHGEPDEVVLRIHNHGRSIPAAELSGLFSPFKRFRSGESSSGDSGNLGLGLYIAERVVTAHGGSIDARSSVEAGTLITIRLPRN